MLKQLPKQYRAYIKFSHEGDWVLKSTTISPKINKKKHIYLSITLNCLKWYILSYSIICSFISEDQGMSNVIIIQHWERDVALW